MSVFRLLALGVVSLTLMIFTGCQSEEESPPPPPPDPDAAAAAAAAASAEPPKPVRGGSKIDESRSSGAARDPAMGPRG